LCDGDYDVLPDGIFVGRIYQDAGAALVLVDLGPPKARSGPRLGDGRDAAPQRYMAQPPCWSRRIDPETC
jgi:hypothetical protein